MLYGLSLSGAGGQIERVRLENVSNNLANAQTAGFKEELLSVMERPTESNTYYEPWQLERGFYRHDLLDDVGGGLWLRRSFTNHETGNISPTGGDFDFAIEGRGFFTVKEALSDETRYTRAGNFKVNSAGELMTADGKHFVTDTSGNKINMTNLIESNGGGQVEVNDEGRIQIINDNGTIDTGIDIAITVFSKYEAEALDKYGENMYLAREDGLADAGELLTDLRADERRAAAKLHHRFLEMSGADPVDQMVKMVGIQRAFEENIRMMTLQNGTLESLISEIGRPG